jgi:predicted HD superfamily hydrolase involved in NAD metabolism
MVPEAVAARIRARELYGLDRHRLLAAVLSPSRYHHSVCVARRARELAVLHALDLERAALAGLLHDCGRALTPDALVRYARRHRLSAPLLAETAAEAPMLLHAYVGEALARRRYGVSDPLVLRAIRTHTLGALDMSAFEKLVYAADACSADRTYPEARPIRAAARRDLDAGLARAVNAKLVHALSEGSWIHPLGIELWNLLEERA